MRRLLALVAVACAALPGCGDGPADVAATLVPGDALVYLHLSTDPGRDADERLLERLGEFPAVEDLLARLPRPLDLHRDVRPWLGDEAAVALLDSGTPRADVLVLAAVEDRAKAEGLLSRVAGTRAGSRWRGVLVRRFSNLAAAFAGDFLAVGQEAAVRRAIDLSRGRGRPLAEIPAYRRLGEERPEDRSADAYVSTAGVRRVLRALPGAGSTLGALLDHPRLRGVGASLVAEEDGLRLTVRSARPGQREFEPELAERVAPDAAAYVGRPGLEVFGPLLGQLRALARAGRADFERDVLAPLRGEVALSVTPRLPAPIMTLVARTSDERRTRETLARLQEPLVEALSAVGGGGAFEQREGAGETIFVLPVNEGLQIAYAVWDGHVAVSTAQAGVEQAIEPDGSLAETERYGETVPDPEARAEALAFVDLSELLAVGEQTGLTGIPGFDAVAENLRRIRVAGAAVRREGPDTTAELFFEIP